MGDDESAGMVRELWARIVAWLDENAPGSAGALVRHGASERDLARAEAASGVAWTEELRTWFRVQGGAGRLGRLQIDRLLEPLSLQESMSVRETYLGVWRQLAADDDDLREDPARRGGSGGVAFQGEFVPIADDAGGSVLVVDLRPGARRGCVGTFVDEDGVWFGDLAWPSIAAWLEDVMTALSDDSPTGPGTAAVEDGHLVWQVPEVVYDGHVTDWYVPDQGDVIDAGAPGWEPPDAEVIAAFLARVTGSGEIVAPPPPVGWVGPWPPELPEPGEPAPGEHRMVVAGMGVAWSTTVGGIHPTPATTRLRLTYRREDDPRAAAAPTRVGPITEPTQVRRSPRRAQQPRPVQEVWRDLVAWLEDHAPETARQVTSSRSDLADVEAAEAAAGMDVPWPDDLRWWFTVAPHLVQNEEGDHLFGPYRAMTAAEAVTDVDMWREIGADFPEAAEYAAGTAAGEEVGAFCPEFVPIASEGGGVTLLVDLRPGSLHGCVLTYSAEEGTSPAGGDGTWPGLAALVLDVLCAVADGDHFEWANAEVSAAGEVLWPFDEDAVPDPPSSSWSWSQARDRVARAREAGDDAGVWAAIVDALLEVRSLGRDEAALATWDQPVPVGDPVLDALVVGAARHAEASLGISGRAWQWEQEDLFPAVPVEADLGPAAAERLHEITPVGFHSVGLLLDPARLPY